MLTPTNPFSKLEMYTQYTPSIGSTDQYLPEIVQHEACRQEWSTLCPTNSSELQFWQSIWNSIALKGRGAQALADCSSGRKRCVRKKWFQNLGNNCLLSPFNTKSEERLVRKKARNEVARREVLKTNGENGDLKFS